MNFDYSDDQKFLKGEARRFLEARCPMATTRSVLDDAQRGALLPGVATAVGRRRVGPELARAHGAGGRPARRRGQRLGAAGRRLSRKTRRLVRRRRRAEADAPAQPDGFEPWPDTRSEASVGKIISARQMQDLATESLDRLDQSGIVMDTDATSLVSGFQRNFFWGSAMRIAGGTDEILKNIIAERVLGLPLDSRVDRDVAPKEIPISA
jgi:alkylation response protein AidB-like acyl-CoA dehydrogenase